jgi:hypothetical protein
MLTRCMETKRSYYSIQLIQLQQNISAILTNVDLEYNQCKLGAVNVLSSGRSLDKIIG